MHSTWQRLEQEKGTLEARLASMDSSLFALHQKDQLQFVTLESMAYCINEMAPQAASLESSLAHALAEARRVRHQLLKSMAENVELRQCLDSVEAERQMVNLSLESAAALSREGKLASSVHQAKVEELQYINIEHQEMIFELSRDLATVKRDLALANKCRQDLLEEVAQDVELQSIIVDTLEEQLGGICSLLQETSASSARQQAELLASKAAVFELQSDFTASISERESLNDAISRLEADNQVLKRSISQTQTEDEALKDTISQMQTDSQANQKLLPLLESQIESLHGNLVQREAENRKLNSQVADLQTLNTSQFVEISILKTNLNDCAAPVALAAEYKADAESSAWILRDALGKIEKLEGVLVQSDAAVLSLRNELLEMQNKLQQTQALLGDWQGKIQGFESETVSASAIIAHLHEQVRGLQQQMALQSSEKDALEARLHVMQDIRIEGQAQLETIKQGLAADREEITSKQEEITSLKGKNVLLEQQISEMRLVDASKERLLALMEQAAESNQDQTQSLTEEHQRLKAVHRQAEEIFDAVDGVCQLVGKLSQSLSEAITDNVFLQGVVARLEGEYEEEQQLSAMLQTQVQTLHAVVLQHEELKRT